MDGRITTRIELVVYMYQEGLLVSFFLWVKEHSNGVFGFSNALLSMHCYTQD